MASAQSLFPARTAAPGPHAGIVAIISMVLFCVSVALFESIHGLHFPFPADSAETMVTYFSTAASRVQFGAFLQCGSAIALGIVTVAATDSMRSLGACGIGIRIAFFGGSIAALLSLLEAGVVWILAQPGVASASTAAGSVVRALYLFAFMLDGPAYAGSLGLLIAGLAVAGLLTRILPRWLAWSGLVLAAFGELSFLSMLMPIFGMLIPLTRFPGYLWLITVGFILAGARASAQSRA
ncbi:MAG: hypothetical protein JWM54_1523 [Acidobacteriaceae bacterium]|nr:hypothetical protein [Acidobacteriaceae bacterium]